MKRKDAPTLSAEKGFKVPDTYVILFVMMVICAVLTYIIPAGQYNLIDGTSMVDPDSFHYVEQTPVTITQFLTSFSEGFRNGVSIIGFTLIVGGFVQCVTDTGALDKGIAALVNKTGPSKAFIMIPFLMIGLSVLGAFGIITNAVVAFIPIGVTLAKKMRVDPIFGIAVIYLACYGGYPSSPVCPFSTVVAQEIAGVEVFSGAWYRIICWFVVLTVTMIWIIRYGKKVQADPTRSIVYGEFTYGEEAEEGGFTTRDALIVADLIIGIVIYTIGVITLDWDTDMMNGVMMVVAVIATMIAGRTVDDLIASFVKGVKSMVYGVMVVCFAQAVSGLLQEGQVIHTIVHYLSIPLTYVPIVAAVLLMYLIQILISFPVSSASGQAYVLMPIMAPLADTVGITRQLSVLIYQFGEGYSNSIVPTSGVTMAMLAAGGVSYTKWLKFMVPLYLVQTLVTAVLILIAFFMGY